MIRQKSINLLPKEAIMEFEQQCKEGIFLKRYNRFLADVQLDDKIITVHVPNTGSLKSCNEKGSPCLISIHNSPDRKIPYTLEAIKTNETWVGVNTSWPNKLAVEAFKHQLIPHWHQYDQFQTEVKISSESRLDLVLWSASTFKEKKITTSLFKKIIDANEINKPNFHLVEVKNVTLKEADQSAQFPDAVTERGQKHLNELMKILDLGFTAEMLYIIQRSDCSLFKPATSIDPKYSELLSQAHKKGLIITPLQVDISNQGIKIIKILPFEL